MESAKSEPVPAARIQYSIPYVFELHICLSYACCRTGPRCPLLKLNWGYQSNHKVFTWQAAKYRDCTGVLIQKHTVWKYLAGIHLFLRRTRTSMILLIKIILIKIWRFFQISNCFHNLFYIGFVLEWVCVNWHNTTMLKLKILW